MYALLLAIGLIFKNVAYIATENFTKLVNCCSAERSVMLQSVKQDSADSVLVYKTIGANTFAFKRFIKWLV